MRHHAIAAMPMPPREKRGLYKTLAFERKCAERRLRATIKGWRAVTIDTHPGSWKQFLVRESAGSIELLGDPSDDALQQLVKVAKQRFGTQCITLLGPKKVRERLIKIVAEHGLEIAQERER